MKQFDFRNEVHRPNENGVYILSDQTINEFMKYLDDLVYKVTQDGDYYVEVITEKYNTVVVLDKNYMGEGDMKLGKILLKGFLANIRDLSLKPDCVLLYNEGVKVTIDEDLLPILNAIEQSGTEFLSCGTCVKYFEIEPKVGSTSNMFNIVGIQMNAKKVIRP